MFFLDRVLIIMVNLSFFIGWCLLIGIKSTLRFFLKKGNLYKYLKANQKEAFFSFQAFLLQLHQNSPLLDSHYKFTVFSICLNHLQPFLYDSATEFPVIGRYLRNPQLKKMADEVSAKGPSV
ncbi:unnamed protein product [Paramecium sonneborni]|uniref:Uncharacterized protein n=1 Tax=Paramecium sonneborni TaxID=65129 RepID=A0A8S1M7B3_9CILI|nr:unnamed protein product [Paramecium sonneborni]